MNKNIKEIYANEGKDLTMLVQDWINENIEDIIKMHKNKNTIQLKNK